VDEARPALAKCLRLEYSEFGRPEDAPDYSRMVASLDRKRLGRAVLWKTKN